MAICESCGREEREVTKVQRMYLAAEPDPGAPAKPEPLDPSARATSGEIEMWCASCCATFPHTVVETE